MQFGPFKNCSQTGSTSESHLSEHQKVKEEDECGEVCRGRQGKERPQTQRGERRHREGSGSSLIRGCDRYGWYIYPPHSTIQGVLGIFFSCCCLWHDDAWHTPGLHYHPSHQPPGISISTNVYLRFFEPSPVLNLEECWCGLWDTAHHLHLQQARIVRRIQEWTKTGICAHTNETAHHLACTVWTPWTQAGESGKLLRKTKCAIHHP